MKSIPAILALLCTVFGCQERVAFYESGAICLDADEVANFANGDPLTVTVVFDECIPGCARNISKTCGVVIDGQTLRIEASAFWNVPPGAICSDSCHVLADACNIAALASGDYTIIDDNDDTLSVTLPSDQLPEQPSPCLALQP